MAHIDTHRLMHELFNTRDWDRVEEHLAPGFLYEDLAQGLTIKTTAEFIDYLRSWTAVFSDARVDSGQYSAGHDFSICTFHGRGTNDGPFGPFPASGKTMDTVYCEVLHYASDGTVLSGQMHYDQLGMLRQLGHLPDPDAATEPGAGPSAGLEPAVRAMFDAFDRLDIDTAAGLVAAQAQGVDEISRRWLRGRDEFAAYFRGLTPMLSDVRSEITGLEEVVWGDTGVATMWIEQDYTVDGEATHVSAPTTMVLRREDGDWKIALVHSIPLPEEG